MHHRALITLGHDEYWTAPMRNAALWSRQHGVNVAFLGANADFRHMRLAASPLGPDRREIDYKVASEDPLYGVKNAQVTADWRDQPDPRPESALNGVIYQCNPVGADMVIVDARSWLFRGTGLRDGDHLLGMVGPEYDRVDPADPTPRTIEILAHSSVVCRGHPDYSDATYYTTRSGAGVFDSGTTGWVDALKCGRLGHSISCNLKVLTITKTLLEAFARGPAGLTNPSRPNRAKLGIHLGDPIKV